MKKRFDKIIKLFFAISMIFSQMYSPLSVFAETINDTDSGDTTSNGDVTDDNTDTTLDVTDTNDDSDETSLEDGSTDNDENTVTDTTDQTENTANQTEDDTDNNEDTTDTGENTNDNTGDKENNNEENTEVKAALSATVNGSVNLVTSDDETKTYNYEVLTDSDDLNVEIVYEVSNSESEDVDLTINDTYTITEDFKFDFGKLASGTYNFTLNLYEESEVVDTVNIVITYEGLPDDTYYDITEDTTLEDVAYMFVSNSANGDADNAKLLAEYLNLNSDLGMVFDSEEETVTVAYGSTTNNVTTIGDVLNDVNRALESSDVSEDTSSIYTGLEIVITFMGETFNYNVVALGDTDTGYVTDSDIQNIIDFSLESKELDTLYAKASDVNQDGSVDVLDVTNVIKAINTDSFEVSSNEDTYDISLTSEEAIRVKDTVVVSFDVSGFDAGTVNGVEGILNYDNTVLKLTAVNSEMFGFGTLNYDNNKFMFADFTSVNADSTIVTFTFEAISEGSTEVSISDVKLALDGTLLDVNNDTASKSINIERALSDNNNLSNVTVSTGTLDKPINSNDTYYVIRVGSDATKINLNGLVADDLANAKGFGEYNLTGSHTIIQVSVTAENGNVKTYTFEVIKDAPVVEDESKVETLSNYVVQTIRYSSDSLIKDLIIAGYEIEFDSNTFEYSINVGSNVKSLDITAILSDPNATYEVFGNSDFKEGENIVTVVVTAEDGTTSTYTIKVNKEAKEEKVEEQEKNNNVVKTIVIGLIILVIIGLIYLIFKDDKEDDEEYSPKNKSKTKGKSDKK